MKKPILRPDSVRVLSFIWRRAGAGSRPITPDDACDALDGYATRKDVSELVRKRILTMIHCGRSEYKNEPIKPDWKICGYDWTVKFTDLGLDLFNRRIAA